MNGEEVKKPWMNLNYIPPVIVDGEKVVEILPEDVSQDDEKWASSLVVYVVRITPSIGAMERCIMGQGNFSTKPIILYHIYGYFVVRFASEEERDMVMCSGTHHLLRRPIIMKPWVLEFNFKEEILTTIPLWVKIPNLPLNYWNSVVLSKIGSSVGKPLYADECTTQTSRISFARILMEVDVTRPLTKVIKIQDPKGKIVEQKVWYEWKPIFCQKCLQVGNSCVDKQAAPVQIQKKNHEEDEATQGQEEWHTMRYRASSRRDSRNSQDTKGGQGSESGVLIYEEGHTSGEGGGGMEMTVIQP
ncbi:uncharacterized protein [Solanum tuberosum]|uniref:uncharacterized protein n=1 Tax=Solanum tuberosum TaxID=4113 RepID=UPI00073A21C3|nr:PREDICTED: uncharacterized protein LOC107062520 [Solanum tuberosum]